MKENGFRTWWVVASVWMGLCLPGCSPTQWPLDEASRAVLQRVSLDTQAQGELVYVGDVFELEGETPATLLYRYERRVKRGRTSSISTHMTLPAAAGEGIPLVLQRAEHDGNYRLLEFTEIHAQSGQRGRLKVGADGGLDFVRVRGGDTTRSTEAAPDDSHRAVVVGPTLFGYVIAHWSALQRGEVLSVRFADLASLQSYHFTLSVEKSDPQTTVVKFSPASWLVRLGIADMFLYFDSVSQKILRYEGRVPPLLVDGQRQSALDARVQYEFVASDYF